jgi:hypothetical protein
MGVTASRVILGVQGLPLGFAQRSGKTLRFIASEVPQQGLPMKYRTLPLKHRTW